MTSRYHEIYESWRRDPKMFWADIAESEIDWLKPWDKVFDETLGVYGRWFPGAECNTCWNCVDRHAAKRPRRAGDHLRQPGHRDEAADQLWRASRAKCRRSPLCFRITASERATASSSICR